MIDMPDHVAGERGNRAVWRLPLIVLLGIALSVVAGMMSYGYTTAQAEQRFADVVDYVATQSLSYEAFNNAYVTKNLIRVMEIAGEVARTIERDGSVDNATLKQYADQFNVSALIVTDASGNLVSESSTDGVGYESLATYLKEAPVLEVASHPLKSYTARITLADDSVADIGCVTRRGGEGIVIAVRHQSAKAVASNTLKLQSLLDGYETIDSGNIVIENDAKVVATNAVEPTTSGAFVLPATDATIVDSIKERCLAGRVSLVNANGEWYLGTFGKARQFYVYTYTSARRYFETVAVVVASVLVLYGGAIAATALARRHAERQRLTDLLLQERDYGDKLAKAAHEASSANSAKTEFLRRMSHDLRTPINGIRGMVEVGDANADDLQKQTECRSKIWTASGLLLDLANEALDMSRLESGQVDLDLVPANLVVLNREVCDILERQAEERLVTIICDQQTLDHPYARVSVTHLKRLLVNIAGNAVKYSRRGGYVRLACREVEPVDGVPIYEYTIADNGIGMSEQFQQHLYEPFSREEQRVEGASSGTGLGAPIAKQLVELMGGTMSFTSTLGQGTTFTIRLPFEQCKRSEIPQAVRVDAVDVDAVRGLRVLLVEDNELNAEIAQFTLDRAGAIVTHVKDGESAVETFAASAPHEYDVVLMDIMMPGIDGLEATRQIRALEREDAATTPIIAVSANAFAEDRRLSREAGMDAHLSKPVSSRELVEALAHIAADAS
ncbi:response regulator [Collinsella aerofaciens]|uniref:hybrid sensor histidine kinase/response regulator n=1 Tax=Collinsella aerofaciens TaxID=74426 RepID=UPI00126095D8|nr:response regulator [Collinsella aerofaciens]VWL64425.1 Sensory/regulatory protein RpfC [Collinsella aerofaciens]